MASLLLHYRYFLFGAFIVCNAIICSVAAWNFSLARDTGIDLQIDVFLIFLGIFGVAFLLPVLFVDIFRKNALPGRVWFECAWVTIFWMLELAGASALTAIAPNQLCNPDAESIVMDACSSTRALLSFTWLITILLLIYLVALTVSAVSHQEDDAGVWHASVRFFPWYQTRTSLNSAPPSPSQNWQKPFALAAPQPKRIVNQIDLRLSPDPEAAQDADRTVPEMLVMSQSGANIIPVSVRYPPPQTEETARQAHFIPQPEPIHSLYPAHVRSKLPQTAGVPIPSGPTPPPLGDWPRTAGRHRGLPRYEPPSSDSAPPQSAPPLPPRPAPTPVVPSSARPPLPQRRGSGDSPTRQRPPPLNLDGISTFQLLDTRRTGRS